MGKKINIIQNNFSHGMQGDKRNKKLVSQSQVFGASKLKHFDIYEKTALSPVPELARFNTTSEEEFKIGAFGGYTDTIYGLGVACENWYSTEWDYRVLVESSVTDRVDYVMFDLSLMPASFWDNVNSDGSDIRITTTSDTQSVEYYTPDFDSVAETGHLIINLEAQQDFYIYYGNDIATAPSLFTQFNLRRFYNFDDGQNTNFGTALDAYELDTPYNYSSSVVGDGIDSGLVTVDGDGGQGQTDDMQSVSFFYRKTSNPASLTSLYFSSSFKIEMNTSGELIFSVDTVGGSDSITSSALSNDTDYVISCVFDNTNNSLKLYLNGVLDIQNTSGSADDLDNQTSNLQFNPANGLIDTISVTSNIKDAGQALAEYNQYLSPATIYTVGSEVEQSSITKTFSGTQVYFKEEGGSWETLEVFSKLVKSDKEPVYSWVDRISNNIVFLTQEDTFNDGSFYRTYGNVVSIFDGELNETLIGDRTGTNSLPTVTYATDKRYLISIEDQLSSYESGVFANGVFLAFPYINSVTNYGYNVALTGKRFNRNTIEIWDLLNDDPTTVIDTRTGEQRIIANIKGNLVGVHDNYISDDIRSYRKPTMEFKTWLGRDNYSTLQSFEYDLYTPTFADSSNDIINNFRTDLSHMSIFHAEPSLEDTGMWAIGVNEAVGSLGVSIPFDTSSVGRVINHHDYGNNVIMVNEDFEHWYIDPNSNYGNTSSFESMIIDAGVPNNKKDFNNIEITLDKPLPSGQTISAYYRKNEDDTYVKIFDFTETGEKNWLANSDINGDSFDEFYELQIKLESSGGDAKITEWSISTEIIEEE